MTGTHSGLPIVLNWVNGQAVAASVASNATSPSGVVVTTPHTSEAIAFCPDSTQADVDAAVAAAKAAFPAWSARTLKDRAAILAKYYALVRDKYTDELIKLIVKEHGKTSAEAAGDVSKGLETVEYAIALPVSAAGKVEEVSRGVTCAEQRVPLGVIASVVPFNFPLMVPHWTLPIALVMGNTMVVKPSEKVPLTMTRVASILKEAGLPDGVFNLVHGRAPAVNAIIDHPDVAAFTFVGTSHVAKMLRQRGTALGKRVLALGGAKNHLVLMPDANPDLAALDIVNSFTGCAGQRCMAASVLLVVGEDKNGVVAKVVERAAKITEKDMGPVIDQVSVDRITKYIAESEQGGAKLLLDGRPWTKRLAPGTWVGPTVIVHTNKADKALHDEIFGPVISVLHVPTLDAALEIERACPYGNAACIYTSSGATAEYAAKRFTAGMVGVNVGVPVPREPFSFGGWGASRFGDCDITGDGGVEFFSQRKKITTKWGMPEERSWMS